MLERAGLTPSAADFWMEAPDHAPVAAVPKFLRSIPRAVALGDALVAYAMNGRPIPLLHGGPLRLVVPGWCGMASTKWLTHVHAMPHESDNYFMAHGYRYADGSPVTVMRPKSVIASPLADQRVSAGRLAMRGRDARSEAKADARSVGRAGADSVWRAPRAQAAAARVAPGPPAALAVVLGRDEAASIARIPAGPGRDLVVGNCLVCHAATMIEQQHKDAAGWDKTVTQMVAWGAPLPPARKPALVAYLAEHFGPRAARPPARQVP